MTVSGRNYTAADLPTAAADLAAGRFAPDTAAAATAASAEPAGRLRDPAAVRDCLAGLDAPGVALHVDLARYQGAPAALLVLSVPADPQQLDVRVVGPGCTATDPQQRYGARVPRS